MLKTPLLLVFVIAVCVTGSVIAALETFAMAQQIYLKENPYMVKALEAEAKQVKELETRKVPYGMCGNNASSNYIIGIGSVFNKKLDFLTCRAIIYSTLIGLVFWWFSSLGQNFYHATRIRFARHGRLV